MPDSTPEGADPKDFAIASSKHNRINIPINLENLRHIEEATQNELLWFHQHALDEALTLKGCAEALGYDTSTVFRVLKGTYEGSWPNVVKAIASYRRLHADRGTIQRTVFTENTVSKMIWAGLDYAVANNSITVITGESGQGKTIAKDAWIAAHNHGRSVGVTAPAIGGTNSLIREIARAVGVGVDKNTRPAMMWDGVLRAFNKNRILIIDEAHRLTPGSSMTNPKHIEMLRDLHDRRGCALGFVATQRFSDKLLKMDYQFEQLLGRVGMPVRLPRVLKEPDFSPVLRQYIKNPSARLLATAATIANEMGRMRVLAEVLKMATRIASKSKQTLTEEHIFKALALRRQMMGETMFAAKQGGAS